jgi:hypothetical protein
MQAGSESGCERSASIRLWSGLTLWADRANSHCEGDFATGMANHGVRAAVGAILRVADDPLEALGDATSAHRPFFIQVNSGETLTKPLATRQE